MAQNGLAYLITIEMSSKTLIAWRRNIPHSLAVTKFIEEINAFQA